jgi:hypothetical protein
MKPPCQRSQPECLQFVGTGLRFDMGFNSRPGIPIYCVMSHYMTQPRSTRAPQKTKAELREMLAEAVRNTAQPHEPKRPAKAKTDRPKKAA